MRVLYMSGIYKQAVSAMLAASVLVLSGCFESDKKEDSTKHTKPISAKAAAVVSVTEAASEPEKFVAQTLSNDSSEIQILDISERSYDGGSALAVTFSSPVDGRKKIQAYFEVTTKDQAVEGEWVLSESGKVAYFDAIEPNTKYQIVVSSGLPAASGKTLEDGGVGEVKTRNIQAAVSFVGQDMFLTLNAQTGLPVTTMNVNEVDVNFYRINEHDLDEIGDLLSSRKTNRYYLKDIEKWAKHLHFARYHLDAPKNKRRNLNLPIQDIDEIKKPGVYLAVMAKNGEYYGNLNTRIFSITDIGLHARFYGTKIKVYANSLSQSKALSEVNLSVLNHRGQTISELKTNAKGEALFDLSQKSFSKAHFIMARNKESVSFIRIKMPALDLSEFKVNQRPYRNFEFFVYGQRDLYRPGETVTLSGLLRNQDGRLSKNLPLHTLIRDAQGKAVKNFSWRGNAQGYYETKYAIAANAPTGNWSVEVKNTDGSLIVHNFKVEEFMPERIKLSFESELFQSGEEIQANLNAMYLYGAPASNNRVSSSAYVRNNPHPIKALKDFHFSNIKKKISESRAFDDTHLDDEGNTTLSLENQWQDAQTPLAVTFSASVYESGGRAVTRTHTTNLMPADKMLGIRPNFGDKNPEQNSQVGFELVYANSEGKKFATTDVEVRLIREERDYYWVYNTHQGWHYEYSDSEYAVQSSRVDIAADSTAKIQLPVEYGYYRLEAIDDQGLVSSVRFYAGYNWYEDWVNNQSAGRSARPDKVSLALDKGGYKAGDTATLSIVPPDSGESLVMVESDNLLWYKRVTVPKAGKKVDIPIKKSWARHDIYISVVHLQPTQKTNNITAKRAIGLIHLPLDRQERKLDVRIDAPEKVLPNQTQMVKVAVEGAKKRAYVTLAAVDVGVLNITRFKTPDPHTFFFEPRRYQIDMRDMYQKLFALNDNALAKQRFGGDMMLAKMEEAKAALSKGGKNAQAEVRVVSLFSGMVAVDSQGNAEIPLKLPDFNGRVRLMAVAFSADAFGHNEQDMTIAAPVVTQIAMPRFLAMGDESTFALDVHNLTEETQNLNISLQSEGSVSIENGQSKIQLKPQEKTTLIYPVKAGFDTGRSAINLEVGGIENYPIKREWGIVTRAAYPALSERMQKWIKPNESLTLKGSKLEQLIPSSLEAVLTLSTHADLDLPRHLNYLLSYPYGCTEQSVSSTYPWLFATDENMQRLGLSKKVDYSRDESIQHGLQRIAQKQLRTGGYGLWSDSSPEEQWLSAYVAEFLYSAREQGISIDNNQYSRTLARLQNYLVNQGRTDSRYSEDRLHSNFASRAYAAYVLSLHKKANLSHLRTLNKRTKDARTPLSILHLALAFQLQGDENTAKELFNKVDKTIRPDDAYFGDYGSNIRDDAQMIRLFLRHNLHAQRIKSLSTNLAESLKGKSYLSTQERNSIFIAGLMLEQEFGEPWMVEVGLKEALETLKGKGTWAKHYAGEKLANGLSTTNKGDKDLLVSVDFQGYSSSAPKPEISDYFNVKREYYHPDTGKPLDISELKVGDLVLVFLHVVVKEERTPDMLVVEMIPAGLELENQNLDTAIKIDNKGIKVGGKPLSYWQNHSALIHQEYRDDRYVAAINADANMKFPLVYLARAVTPGVYQVPPTLIEDMYRPQRRVLGNIFAPMRIKNP